MFPCMLRAKKQTWDDIMSQISPLFHLNVTNKSAHKNIWVIFAEMGKIEWFWFWIDGWCGLPVKPNWGKLQFGVQTSIMSEHVWSSSYWGHNNEEPFILQLLLQLAENNDCTTALSYYHTGLPLDRLQGFLLFPSQSNCTNYLYTPPPTCWPSWPLLLLPRDQLLTSDIVANDVAFPTIKLSV